MPKPRCSQVSLEATPYTIVCRAVYPKHFVGQALRRAFLCGEGAATFQSFEHRRQWVEDRLNELAQVFAINLCGYAVMSNHYHVVFMLMLNKPLIGPLMK